MSILLKTRPARQKPSGIVTKISMRDLPVLAARLASCNSEDPYLVSAAYYGFTGRNGLWTYEEEGKGFILFCRHPNIPDKTLIFPSVNPQGIDLTKNLLQNYFTPEDDLQLARLTPWDAEEAVTRLSWITQGYHFEVMDELFLDWLYPVHTLSTKKVTEHKGGAFNAFRGRLYQVDQSRIRVEELDIDKHYFDLLSLSMKWARDRADGQYTVKDMFEPNLHILRMARKSGLDMRGTVIYMDDACVSFSIWEMPVDKSRPASSAMMLAHGPSKGLSELQQLERCRALQDAGVERVCIGGSETPGLDAHKKKMAPVESLALKSVSVSSKAQIHAAAALKTPQ
ncbi:MAG: hypothetical protein OXT65_09490 [Alphaproteobacteria bacterium]|nr:hypothetical protein [Alphaproteobacteria bacterium]